MSLARCHERHSSGLLEARRATTRRGSLLTPDLSSSKEPVTFCRYFKTPQGDRQATRSSPRGPGTNGRRESLGRAPHKAGADRLETKWRRTRMWFNMHRVRACVWVIMHFNEGVGAPTLMKRRALQGVSCRQKRSIEKRRYHITNATHPPPASKPPSPLPAPRHLNTEQGCLGGGEMLGRPPYTVGNRSG